MAYAIKYALDVIWVGDGDGPMTPSVGAQRKKFVQTAVVPVPGADAPSAANFNTAIGVTSGNVIAGSMAADLQTQVLAALTQIQGWATGGG